ncbi:MAG: hypothetical protein LBT05_04820 [Planctomycetaceae bacterium]|jgi:Holliday junction resolvase|nr:hypothetical protein [Planctomycetaceae bacterium]
MGLFSRNKGKYGERELARELSRVLGITASRGVQFQGSPDSPDVVTEIPNIHIECKRTERLQIYDAMQQAITDAGISKIPVVLHRRNRKEWLVIVRLNDLPTLVQSLSAIGWSKNASENLEG